MNLFFFFYYTFILNILSLFKFEIIFLIWEKKCIQIFAWWLGRSFGETTSCTPIINTEAALNAHK